MLYKDIKKFNTQVKRYNKVIKGSNAERDTKTAKLASKVGLALDLIERNATLKVLSSLTKWKPITNVYNYNNYQFMKFTIDFLPITKKFSDAEISEILNIFLEHFDYETQYGSSPITITINYRWIRISIRAE